jgi:tetratricopeptide (TPR) repeat protein
MIKLNCPSCNGSLELPDNLGVAHCMYCGTKILLQQPTEAKEKDAIQRYKELCKTALESKNYDEVIKFCNSILEMDTRDVDAWIYKAEATWWLTTETNNHYEEAVEYCKKAEEISPSDASVHSTLESLKHRQADWFIYLGKNKSEQGYGIYNDIMSNRYYTPLEIAERDLRATLELKKYIINAMNDFLKAAQYFPNDINILRNIEDLVTNSGLRIDWSDSVMKIVRDVQMIRDRPLAEQHLPILKQQLQEAQKTFAVLKNKNYIFNKSKIDDAENEIKFLREKIAKYEVIIAYKVTN